MNILVIKQSSLGDVLHSTAALRAIKAQHPKCHITVLTHHASRGVLENNPDVDDLILFDYALVKKHFPVGLRVIAKEFARVKKQMNRRQYSLAFDLQGLLRSVLFLYAAKADKKYVKGRWLGLPGFRNKQLHAIEEMAQVLNLASIAMPTRQMRLVSTDIEVNKAAQVLNSAGLSDQGTQRKMNAPPLIVVSPFTRWPSKNWPLASFISLAEQLSQGNDCAVVITGTEGDKAQIEAQTANIAAPGWVNLAGQLSIGELAALMNKAALVISGDSFPMHLASAVNTPLVALFGPTDENKTGALGSSVRVIRPDDCDKCDKPSCPRQCLQNIPVSQVLEAANTLID